MSRLLCTFAPVPELGNTVDNIRQVCPVILGKIFVLYAESRNEFLVTYNASVSDSHSFPENTVPVHRRKQTNTLYTLNALNRLVCGLNRGMPDKNYTVDWNAYKNTALLVREPDLQIISTKIYKIYGSDTQCFEFSS